MSDSDTARRFVMVLQDERGYPNGPSEPAPPEGPKPPTVVSVVQTTDYESVLADRDDLLYALNLTGDEGYAEHRAALLERDRLRAAICAHRDGMLERFGDTGGEPNTLDSALWEALDDA